MSLEFVHCSLAATIKNARPDLLPTYAANKAKEIPEEPPPHFFDKHIEYIEDIGEPTNPCFFTSSSINPSNWYALIEKGEFNECVTYLYYFPSIKVAI